MSNASSSVLWVVKGCTGASQFFDWSSLSVFLSTPISIWFTNLFHKYSRGCRSPDMFPILVQLDTSALGLEEYLETLDTQPWFQDFFAPHAIHFNQRSHGRDEGKYWKLWAYGERRRTCLRGHGRKNLDPSPPQLAFTTVVLSRTRFSKRRGAC